MGVFHIKANGTPRNYPIVYRAKKKKSQKESPSSSTYDITNS